MKHFTIRELYKSSTADHMGIDNTPLPEVEKNLTLLIENILDPIREAYGAPISVVSGYRCPILNSEVKGSTTSQHVTGQAADISVGSRKNNEELFMLIRQMDLPFDQLINENEYQWVHISYDPNRTRQQILNLSQ